MGNTKEVQAMQLPINKLRPFENLPFQVKDDAEMNQLTVYRSPDDKLEVNIYPNLPK